MDFLRLPLVAVMRYAFYGEALTVWVFIGALIDFLATWLNLKSVSNSSDEIGFDLRGVQ